MRQLTPPLDEKINERLSVIVSHVGTSRMGLPCCRAAVWDGKELASDILEPDKASDRRKFIRLAATKDPTVKATAGVIDDVLLKVAAALRSQPMGTAAAPNLVGPTVEFLDTPPLALTKPLQLIDGRAYAATWLHVRSIITQRYDEKSGKVVTLDPPLAQIERRLFVVDQDGTLYGDGGDRSLEELGFEVKLADPPPDDKLWSNTGAQAFRSGQRPNAVSVFDRVASAYDYYLDFSRSLGTQEQMCRLSACLSIATFLHDAFTVMGYPWPNGDKGCGKTKWATVWTATSYLGMLITAGGSFAALRDLAEHGATLAIDDAENLADPKKSDPDKRALLLAGNRRGVRIPLKEQVGDKWQTRWVNSYAPRGFTAIALPDEVLHSRSLIVPLVRSGDQERANRDPGKLEHWPCNVSQLKDDLWALALWLLPEAAGVWTELDTDTSAFGRDLEPWRAAIATARLLERHGVADLERDVRAVMRVSFEERSETIGDDRTRAVVLALVRYVETQAKTCQRPSDILTFSDNSDVFGKGCWNFKARNIVDSLKTLAREGAEDDTLDDEAMNWATPKTVGWQLSRLRLRKKRAGDKKGSREREVTDIELRSLARAFGISSFLFSRASEKTSETSENVRTSEAELSDDECRTCGSTDIYRYTPEGTPYCESCWNAEEEISEPAGVE